MFQEGRKYNRRLDIHGAYGGQRQSGIVTPRGRPILFLFSSEQGKSHGYSDGYREDGSFWYTGEGQVGDMQFVRGNRAIRDHIEDGKKLLLFTDIGKGKVVYEGEFRMLGSHFEEKPDTTGSQRTAIVFELEPMAGAEQFETTEDETKFKRQVLGRLSDEALRELAVKVAHSTASKTLRRYIARRRADAIRIYAKRRAAGVCEACQKPAPFLDSKGEPFLEVHHLDRLSDGGADHPDRVAAICPNCHRQAHHGDNSSAINNRLEFVRRT